MTLQLLALLACGVSQKGFDDLPCVSCSITDDNQFAYDAVLSAQIFDLAAEKDAVVSWNGLSRDIHGHPLDPAEVDMAYLVALRDLTPEQVLAGLESDSLVQADVTAYLSCQPVDNACALSDFGNMGNTLEVQRYFTPGTSTWMVVLSSSREPGALALAFINPSHEASASVASFTDTTAELDVEVDFAALSTLAPETSNASLILDWSALTVDGLGNPFHAPSVTELFVGRYDRPRDELEGVVFDLEAEAEESWTMSLGGSTWANLASLSGDTTFEGIEPGSTWMVALLCGECMDTAPRLVTFLEADGS